MEVLFDPLTEAAHIQGLGTGQGPGSGHDAASRQGLGPGSGPGLGQWLTYTEPLHRLREFGVVGVHVGGLDRGADQALAPVIMHR